MKREEGARAISEGIDGELMRERNVVRKRRERVVKLLLLGQSESGEYEWFFCCVVSFFCGFTFGFEFGLWWRVKRCADANLLFFLNFFWVDVLCDLVVLGEPWYREVDDAET